MTVVLQPAPPDQLDPVRTVIRVGPTPELARPVGVFCAPLPQPSPDHLIVATGGGPVMAAIEEADGEPVIRFLSCPDIDLVDRHMRELGQPVIVLTAGDTAPVSGSCRVCGCTQDHACPAGCWWEDDTRTLCRQHGTT
jgi:hypothetical protein